MQPDNRGAVVMLEVESDYIADHRAEFIHRVAPGYQRVPKSDCGVTAFGRLFDVENDLAAHQASLAHGKYSRGGGASWSASRRDVRRGEGLPLPARTAGGVRETDDHWMAAIEARRGATADPARARGSERLLALEALRGVLAIVVVAHHFVQSFLPGYQTPNLLALGPTWLVGTPLEVLINGPAAVVVFYVITGFVLTVRAFSGESAVLAPAALKRWPRLAGPVLVSVLLSWGLFATSLYRHTEAGAINQSVFLVSFFDQMGGQSPGAVFQPSFLGAVYQGLVGTFLFGDKTYNPVIWMMHTELQGGLVALLLAAYLRRPSRSPWRIPGYVLFVLASVVWPAFLAGVLLARLFASGRLRLGGGTTVALAGLAAYLLGAASPWGVYAWLGTGWSFGIGKSLAHTLGGVLLVSVFLGTPRLTTALSGPVSRALGAMSFPLYLVHGPVIAVLGVRAYISLEGVGADEVVVVAGAIVVTVLGCAPLVYALARFDRWWVRGVNRGAEWLLPSRAATIRDPAAHATRSAAA